MRENCTSGSAQGASGNGRSYCEMRDMSGNKTFTIQRFGNKIRV